MATETFRPKKGYGTRSCCSVKYIYPLNTYAQAFCGPERYGLTESKTTQQLIGIPNTDVDVR
jgi:hypothetical protein